ncbi:acetyl-CoA acetyltransferase [Pseudonocardia hydrocarbonoxydans]|uniref:Acetyl-CoA acetyltransferase n=1 Tax=Pseudonocardia hydrocarbonoxydans TaxID=76726 RepID=A0A4Y3WM71_9PSEU|nr:acetyl-CoA acetyltransferase [Pseudonocardia hydrocarbonoxydans]GEC18959.1 acetyl-CoA acetyltransferase [Pseudonocardia hydrocarbonoxydans]
MTEQVFVLGGAQTDFAVHWTRTSDEPLRAMLADAVTTALADADVAAADVGTAHVGNLAAELFTGQAHLGALLTTLDPAWSALPTSRHEAACASGSVAVLAATAEIEAGRYDVALVTGVELMRNVGGRQAADHLGCAAWVGREEFPDGLPWPTLFERIAEEVDERDGLDRDHLRRIAEINRENARANPLAQTRGWTDVVTAADDAANPPVVGRMRAADCGRITDGAAAVVLAGRRYAQEWSRRTGRTPAVIRGWGHRTGSLGLQDKLDASRGAAYLFPHLRTAITEAYGRAGIAGPEELDAIELHDCFTITEYVALEHLGIPAARAIDDGRIARGGALPVNPSGGLIGAGHPVGATGVRMLHDAARQVTGRAGETQVEGAETVATLNIGGSAATVVSLVVGTVAG